MTTSYIINLDTNEVMGSTTLDHDGLYEVYCQLLTDGFHVGWRKERVVSLWDRSE